MGCLVWLKRQRMKGSFRSSPDFALENQTIRAVPHEKPTTTPFQFPMNDKLAILLATLFALGADPALLAVPPADAAFIQKAADGNMSEVSLGEMAAHKGQTATVREFGLHMVKDHSVTARELQTLAAAKKVSLPSKPGPESKATAARLAQLSGAAFDHAYVADMVEDHQKDVAEFRHESKAARDPEVKAFASKTLPVLQSHLTMITHISTMHRKGDAPEKKRFLLF